MNNEKKSAVVIRAVIGGKERSFNFPEKTDPEAIKAYIVITAKNNNLEVHERDIYYMGNRSLNIDSPLDSLETINDYVNFVIKLNEEEQKRRNNESKAREWNFSFNDVVERSHKTK